MKLRTLSAKTSLRGKRVLLRVDWNIPLYESAAAEDHLKLQRNAATIENLASRGAIVIVLTHLGRPKAREAKFSTERLVGIFRKIARVPVRFIGDDIESKSGMEHVLDVINSSAPGSVLLLENVRFYRGEETNSPTFVARLASLGDIFVNDAFASCHRSHASVVGVAKSVPSYAGPALVAEVEGMERIFNKPKRPFISIIGGVKLSTKIGVIKTLLSVADRVYIGGAMANPFFKARRLEIGKSIVEKESVVIAKALLKNPKLKIPTDVLVARALKPNQKVRCVPANQVKNADVIGDIGTETMMDWASEIKTAKTILWNGPVGVAEIPSFSHGSLVLTRAIAARSKSSAYGVVGGGDTLPIVARSGMAEWIDHLSTGGGAMLEFIANKGNLPGLLPLKLKK
ncbi:MAG: phosphoglycerate kinase [Patescibacteria group bacterium]